MKTRSSRSIVTFFRPFTLAGNPDVIPAGDYEVLIEEERLEGRGFLAYRKTATYVFVAGKGGKAGKMEKLEVSGTDLETMLSQDRETPGKF
ncbi:hypothetical protein [Roseibium marinum]|uniref:Uncharacterized protein n=1 Tax=Roseibium marinum TaxID=281252 RepID=A0A2S3UYY8_9HYPH|nr:hypothetical protein [Roseibium marinum]POF32820.1 hypothetical protein CLV41_102225 [Roseibium marinum]